MFSSGDGAEKPRYRPKNGLGGLGRETSTNCDALRGIAEEQEMRLLRGPKPTFEDDEDGDEDSDD